MSAQVVLINLGKNNTGQLGPKALGLSREQTAALESNVSDPAYETAITSEWGCVDGRTSDEEEKAFDGGEDTRAIGQIGGGWVITGVSADLMVAGQKTPLSKLTANETTRAVDDDHIDVTLHGDETNDANGCYANREQRSILLFNAANLEVVGPLTWTVSSELGLEEWISEDDVAQSIMNGKTNAENEDLWDVDTQEIRDIIVAHGGRYVVLRGKHTEGVTLVKVGKGGFRKARFKHDHQGISAFVATLGEYKDKVFESAGRHGETNRDAALKVMRAVAYTIGLSKLLHSQDHTVALEKAA